MKYDFGDLRKICERLTFNTEQKYKIRLLGEQYFILLNGKILFQTSKLKEAREYLMNLEARLKSKGLF